MPRKSYDDWHGKMDKGLLEFLQEYHPETLEQHKRLTTPNYWECGVVYNPQVSGFGCSGKSEKKLVLKDATVYKEDKHFTLYELNDPKQRYICTEKEAPFKLKRFDESVEYKDNMINDGVISYLTIGDNEYKIRKYFDKSYSTGKVIFVIWVSVNNSSVTWEYYNRIGKAEPVLKVNKPRKHYLDREDYDIHYKVSVRKFKEMVFGDPNIKIPSTKGKI